MSSFKVLRDEKHHVVIAPFPADRDIQITVTQVAGADGLYNEPEIRLDPIPHGLNAPAIEQLTNALSRARKEYTAMKQYVAKPVKKTG